MIKVLPSSNPEKEENLVNYVREMIDLGVEYLHCDTMDGVFVENKCLAFDTLKNVRNSTNILLDVHLMVQNPIKVIKDYISLKPSIITVHYEAVKNVRQLKKMSKMVRGRGLLFGVSLCPSTPASVLVGLLDYIDLVLVMSVVPGKSGQSFIEGSLEKIKDVKCLVENRDIIIEVDGGINLDNYKSVVDAGATFLVMGNAFYKSDNRAKLLEKVDAHYKVKKTTTKVVNK